MKVRDGQHVIEEREARLAVLRAALIEDETSGPSEHFDFETFLARKRRELTKNRLQPRKPMA